MQGTGSTSRSLRPPTTGTKRDWCLETCLQPSRGRSKSVSIPPSQVDFCRWAIIGIQKTNHKQLIQQTTFGFSAGKRHETKVSPSHSQEDYKGEEERQPLKVRGHCRE